MALQDVKNDILTEAREKADKIESEAEEEVDEIINRAEEKAEGIKDEAREEVEEEKKSRRKRVLSNARMSARQKKLEAKQEKIQEVFDSLNERIVGMNAGEREKLVQEAVESAEFDVGTVKGSEEFEDAVDQRKMEFMERDMDGFILVSENGERSKDFSLDKITENMKDRYRKEVADRLFGDSS
ncbi:MAG: V-type ATP synthase subunit E family protein [Candidatus Nanohalobium sp.]